MRRRFAIIVLIALLLISCTSTREKETQLKNNLFTLRNAITQYTLDKQKAPQALSQVLEAGYIREVPEDPMTGKRDWQVIYGRRLHEYGPDPTRHLGREEHLARDFHRRHSVQQLVTVMCDMCQMQFGLEHEAEAAGNIPCPRCLRFYVSPEQETCYHCWAEESGLEGCDQCVQQGAPKPIPTQ